MSQLLDENDELLASPTREMALGTGSILAIFFGLTLLCALFFGFGYNVGHKSASAALLPVTPDTASASASPDAAEAFRAFKPAAAKTPSAISSESTPASDLGAGSRTPSAGDPASASYAGTRTPAAIHSAPSVKPAATSPALPHPVPFAAANLTATSSPATSAPQPAAGAAGTFFVQVAAVSHPEDASLLVGALRARGYTVAERTEAADKLIRIQVGPFASKPAAEVMRQRLLGDGYNAIIK